MKTRRCVAVLTAALVATLSTSAWSDKNPRGDFFRNGMPSPTRGSGAAEQPCPLVGPPLGWTVGKPLPACTGVRHDLTFSNWKISNAKTGEEVGHWEWDTGSQNFTGTYVNGVIDRLHFEEWNDWQHGGHIRLSGFNSLGIGVHFVGTVYETYAEGTATADVRDKPYTWPWRADFP